MKKSIRQTTGFLKEKGFDKPEIGIVLGTGLGQLLNHLHILLDIGYDEIPNFPAATVEFHKGRLIYGLLEGKKLLVMQGRFHMYEGYTLQEITFPIRAMHQLGIEKLLISNAAGAINPTYKKGELMLLDDHINLQGGSPLGFRGASQFGDRFVDMSAPYDPILCNKLEHIAKEKDISLHKGVYAAVTGPQLETRAEYRYLGTIGADAVGMSTVPEVIVANHLKLPVMAVSVLTDECSPDNLKPVSIQEIMEAAAQAEPQMILLFKELIRNI